MKRAIAVAIQHALGALIARIDAIEARARTRVDE